MSCRGFQHAAGRRDRHRRPGGGSLYVSDGDKLLAIDALSGKLQASWDLGLMAGSFGLALDRQTGTVVVADVISRGVKTLKRERKIGRGDRVLQKKCHGNSDIAQNVVE